MMLSGFTVQNFTAFKELDVALSPRINVIIGNNGTGKTHLLKAIYALAMAGQVRRDAGKTKPALEAALSEKFLRLFLPMERKIGALRSDASEGGALLCVTHS